MTFDARRTPTQSNSGTLKFALITITVVIGAFLTVLFVPWPTPKTMHTVTVHSSRVVPANDPFTEGVFRKNKAAQTYFKTLAQIDPDAAADARSMLSSAADTPADQQAELLFDQASELFRTRAQDISNAPTSHFDALLNLTRDRLNTAARQNNKWCRGARYAEMADMEFSNPAEFTRQFDALKPALQDYSFEVMSRLLLAAEDGHKSPIKRSKLSPQDQMALQGVVFSLMSDPEFRPLIEATQPGSDAEAVMRKMNLCRVAATAISAVKTLPQDTKGRLFAELAHSLAEDDPTFGTVGGFPGF